VFGNVWFGYALFQGPRSAEATSSLGVDCQTTGSSRRSTRLSFSGTLGCSLGSSLGRRVSASGVFSCSTGLESALVRARLAESSFELDLLPAFIVLRAGFFESQIAFQISSSASIHHQVGLASGIAFELIEASAFSRALFLAGETTLDFSLVSFVSRTRPASALVEVSLLSSTLSLRLRALAFAQEASLYCEASLRGPLYLAANLLCGFEIMPAANIKAFLTAEVSVDLSAFAHITRPFEFHFSILTEVTASASALRSRSILSSLELEGSMEGQPARMRYMQSRIEPSLDSTSELLRIQFVDVFMGLEAETLPYASRLVSPQLSLELSLPTEAFATRQVFQEIEAIFSLETTASAIRTRFFAFSIAAELSCTSTMLRGALLSLNVACEVQSQSSCLRKRRLSAIIELKIDPTGSIRRFKPLICSISFMAQCSISPSRRRRFAIQLLVGVGFIVEAYGPPTLPARWWPRLIVKGVDLSHRLKSCRLSFSFDSGAWTLDLELTNYQQLVEQGEGLDPFDPISRYNTNGPLLGSYNPVEFSLIAENGYVWQCFTGYVGPLDRSSQEAWGEAGTISVSCVGPSQPLKDYFIPEWEARRYTEAIISKEGQPDLLNRILMDQGFAPIIGYIDDPYFHVDEYIIGGVSLWEALENALAPTGFRLVEYMTIEGLKIRVKDPLRFRTDPDRVLVGGFRSRRITGNEADVRTWVAVVYRDRNDFQEKVVWAEADPDVVAVFGIPDGQGGRKHKRMVYKTSERSLIDSESEARELAATILWDLQYPTPNIELEIPWMDPLFRPFQLVRAIGETISTDFGVMEIDWEWSWENPYGSTSVRGSTGRVIGAKGLWFAKDAKKELARIQGKLDELTNEACPSPNAPEVYGAWYVHADGSPNPVIDIYIPETPPYWASGIRVYVWSFKRVEEGQIGQLGTNWFAPQGKTYSDYRFGAAYRDYVVFTSGTAKNKGAKIITTLSNHVITASDLPPGLSQGDGFWIVRLKDIQSFEIGLTNYYRLTGLDEGEAVAVSFAWIPMISR
jgi:hypothetical protein